MKLRVREVRIYLRRVRTRMPFRYGKAEVTGLPYAHLRVRMEPDVTGVSASALPPLWFDKRPATHDENIRELLRSISIASEVYPSLPPDLVFNLHRAAEPEVRRRAAAERMNDLTAGFGVALLDAALIDAACRLSGRTFHQALREDVLGTGPDLARSLPEKPLSSILVRHTVGMSDPLTAADLKTPLNDGHPETLEEVVRRHGVIWFKVKMSSDIPATLDRLERIASILNPVENVALTLDGNEQFSTMEEVEEFVRRFEAAPKLKKLFSDTAWIEQPLERSKALLAGVAPALRRISERKPLLIDESDGSDAAVDQAFALGYEGISAKNCKGIFRTLHSYRIAKQQLRIPGLSSEDLMNIPVVPLQQDLCVAAALGIPHSERNGHHYVRAFDYLSPREREAALREYPELYRADPAGVRIERGEIDVRGINAFGFGVRSEPDWDFLSPS